MRDLIVAFILLTSFTSCKIAHSLIELNREYVKVYTYTTGEKEIKYIPMHHLGKQMFYDDVRSTVLSFKQQGYRVYYELVSTDFTTDSLLKDTIRRKARKLKGFNGTYQDNAEGTVLEKYVQQPSYDKLGITASDLRADVNYLQLIQEWEKVNGEIVLDSSDINTPFSEKFAKGVSYTRKQYNATFINYRNNYLIQQIQSGSDTKILILYGAGHRKDFKKRLKDKL